MPVLPNPILDLQTGIGQARYEIRFQVLDQNLSDIGWVYPLKATGVTAATSGSIKRQLSGVVFNEPDLRELNPFRDRIKPYMVLEDGTYWPLGVFVFTNAAKHLGSFVSTLAVTLMDQEFILSQGIVAASGVNPGGSLLTAISTLLDQAGVQYRNIPATSTATAETAIAWPVGTARLKMITDICKLAGWLPPYFDNDGGFVIKAPPSALSNPDHEYTTDRAQHATVTENQNLLSAPNVFIVLCNGAAKSDISAVAYVDPALPFSVENRGYAVPSVTRAQGISSTQQAQTMADALAAGGAHGYKNVDFTGPPDPRHDLFQTVDWMGTIYRELKFDLQFAGMMTHSLTIGGFANG